MPYAELHQNEDKLTRLLQAIESNPVIVMITDATGRIEHVNQKFTELTGYSSDEVLGHNAGEFGDHDQADNQAMWSALKSGREWQGRICNRKKNGENFWEEGSIFPIKNSAGYITHFVKVTEDITERRNTEETVRFLAFYDSLTELPNRRLFLDRLNQTLAMNRRANKLLAVLSLDLDGFKNINNTFGHAAGDMMLRTVGDRLMSCLRSSDTVAHYSGDTFKILLAEITKEEHAAKVAQNLLNNIEEPLIFDGQEVFVTASIGISLFPADGEDAATLMKHADLALHRVKDKGRNSYQFFTPAMNERALNRQKLENNLRRTLRDQGFELFFQPQFDSLSQELIGAEALIRCQDPERGLVSPGEYILLAEETDLILPLGEWVLRNACGHIRTWNQHKPGLPRGAVNLSPRQFRQPNLLGMIEGILQETGLSPEMLEIEITESAIMENLDLAVGVLETLRDMGVSVALDDFGTGHSSLSNLKRFPVDTLKIDRSFISEIASDRGNRAIVSAMTGMAHDLNLKVVAEGVETAEQQQILVEMGCDILQGFLLGRPMPAEEFASFASCQVR